MFGVRGHLLQKGGVSPVAGGRAGQGLIILPPGNCASVHTLAFSYPSPVRLFCRVSLVGFGFLWQGLVALSWTLRTVEKHQHVSLSLSFLWPVAAADISQGGFPVPSVHNKLFQKGMPFLPHLIGICALWKWCVDDLGPSTRSHLA